MTTQIEKNGQLSLLNLNVAEAQIVYNALSEYRRSCKYRKVKAKGVVWSHVNMHHLELAEKMFDQYHEAYCDEKHTAIDILMRDTKTSS